MYVGNSAEPNDWANTTTANDGSRKASRYASNSSPAPSRSATSKSLPKATNLTKIVAALQ